MLVLLDHLQFRPQSSGTYGSLGFVSRQCATPGPLLCQKVKQGKVPQRVPTWNACCDSFAQQRQVERILWYLHES